jgi:hypothetical protein
VLDMVFMSKMARRHVRDTLTGMFGAGLAWEQYHRVLTWWAFRTPVAYLVLCGVFKVLTDRLGAAQGNLGIAQMLLGTLFLVSMSMSVLSALRLLPSRECVDPPADWLESEARMSQRSQ